MAWVRDINSFYDFTGYVVLSAPDRFPRENYVAENEQMTLDRAFAELRNGVCLVEADSPGANAQRGLTDLLDQALISYRDGDDVRGAHLLQDLERLVFIK